MNTYLTVACVFAFVTVLTAQPPARSSYIPVGTIGKYEDPSYKFSYAVNDPTTGDNKAQWESRHGDFVHGAYSLVEPDGNVRHVEYSAGPHSGFNAHVKRTGPHIHAHKITPAPVVYSYVASEEHKESDEHFEHAPVEHAPPSTWVHLIGTTYGKHGKVLRSWETGPIVLEGKTLKKLTIKTKH